MSVIVVNAIAQLKQIEDAMKRGSYLFTEADIENCDRLADLLQELENEVKRVEDELETETIKTNVYRHKMEFLHLDTLKELEENINAARESNMAVILGLKERLENLTKSIHELQIRDKELSESISKMQVEKDELEVNHENIIVTLNDDMAEKAKAQIHLNETRDILRETNQTIMNLEEEIINLKEQLVKEKTEAREEKARLEEQKYNTNMKATNQEDINREKNREVEGVKRKLQETNRDLRAVYRENERLEQYNEKLAYDIENGTTDLAREQKELEYLTLESLRLTSLEAQIQQDFVKNKEELIQKTKETSELSRVEAENLKKLKEDEEKLRDQLKDIYDLYNELQKFIHGFKKSIDEMKTEIGARLQEMAEMDVKNHNLAEELSRAQSIHHQVMESLQREAEEYKAQIQHERELRLKKQQQRDAQLLVIEEFNGTFSAFQSEVTNFLSENRAAQRELIEREGSVGEKLEVKKQEISRLNSQIEEAESKFKVVKDDLDGKIANFEATIAQDTEQNNTILAEINNLTPGYDQLCKFHEQTEKDFDQVKLKYIATKNYKGKLETAIESLKEETNEHDSLRETITNELNVTRRESINLMKTNHQDLINLENKILHTGLRLQTIKKENERFINAIKNFKTQFDDIDSLNLNEIDDQDRLEAEYHKLHEQLLKGWREDMELQIKFTKNDQELIQRLDDLLKLSNNRESEIGSVKDNLSTGLNIMNEFLGKMGNKKMEPVVDTNRIQEAEEIISPQHKLE